MDVIKMIKENNNELSREEIMEELYWTSLNAIGEDEMINIVKPFLMDSEKIEEFAAVQRLYSNPDGAYISFFEDIIISLYKMDPLTFIKAVANNPDEGMNVLYIFRNRAVFLEVDSIKEDLLKKADDNDTKEMIESFFRYYDSICST